MHIVFRREPSPHLPFSDNAQLLPKPCPHYVGRLRRRDVLKVAHGNDGTYLCDSFFV